MSHEKEISRRAIELQRAGTSAMPLDFADPLEPFKDAFGLLLAPKKLLDPDPRSQQLFYEYEGARYPLSSLSSGEREVVNIVFDFILRTSSDCIVFFDEPELHLHPELSYKLLQALRTSGLRNQFVFCTHSPDIITASLDQSVIFLSPPAQESGKPVNQAIAVREDDTTNQALRLLGQSIGVVALGRRLVLVEGASASLDKQTYGLLLKNRFPNLVLVPSGGKNLIRSFSQIVTDVLDRTIWGVGFFMLCDRDAADAPSIAEIEASAKGRLRFLKRYHLENYFLDPYVIAAMFQDQEPENSWLRNPSAIDTKLREIAREAINYATVLLVSARVRRSVGNVDLMVKGGHALPVDDLALAIAARAKTERERVEGALREPGIEALVRQVHSELSASLEAPSDTWRAEIPGKLVISRFAPAAKMELARFKTLYLATAERTGSNVFDDIIDIFQTFSSL